MTIVAAALASCGSGGGPGQPVPQQSELTALLHPGGTRVSAGPGSADPGSVVSVESGGTGEGTVRPDGSFSLDVDPLPAQVDISVRYTKQGITLTGSVSPQPYSSLLDLNHFATGSGPNDMIYSSGSLYVANSLDNSVTRHGMDGEVLASALFAEFSSPSQLALDGPHLYSVNNGSNAIVRLDNFDLSYNQTNDVFQLSDPAAVFIGPGRPAVVDDRLYVPRSQVLQFPEFGSGDPTIYGDGMFTEVDYRSVAPTARDFQCEGRNPQFAAYNSVRDQLIVVSGGELNFSPDFTPYVSTDSFVEIYSAGDTVELLGSITLGRTGAGNIAISPDGSFAYLGNAINGNLYKVDLVAMQALRGAEDPIVLTGEFTYISDVEVTADGRYVLATSFNTDELYILSTGTDTVGDGPYPGPLDMSQSVDLLAGAAAVELDGDGHAWVLNALANSVNRVSLLP